MLPKLHQALREGVADSHQASSARPKIQLQELLDLVKFDEKYTVAVAYGAIEADHDTALAHQRRTTRIVVLMRNYGLK